jgi:hypothetical protein
MRLVSVVHEDALVLLAAVADLAEQIVDLPRHRPHLDLGVDQPVGRMTCSTTTPCAF